MTPLATFQVILPDGYSLEGVAPLEGRLGALLLLPSTAEQATEVVQR